jgi:replicative DNA helicase
MDRRKIAGLRPLEAEKQVLKELIADPGLCTLVQEKGLQGGHFSMDSHKRLYEICMKGYEDGEPADLVVLASKLMDKPELFKVFQLLMSGAGLSANLPFYVRLIQDRARRRSLMTMTQKLQMSLLDLDMETEELVGKAQGVLQDLEGTTSKAWLQPRSILDQLQELDRIRKIANASGQSLGVHTGIRELDELLGLHGLEPGHLCILAARPAMGKTALALQVAQKACREGRTVAIVSLEMTSTEVMNRMLIQATQIPSDRMEFTSREVQETMGQISTLPLFIRDPQAGARTWEQIRGAIQGLHARSHLDLIVLDYLQLIEGPPSEPAISRVSRISRGLKLLAVELGVPIICLSQLSRGPESRDDKRPRLSDLRDSGSIEQDADQVLFPYRPGYYNQGRPDEMQVIVGKNRHGSTGYAAARWKPQTMTVLSSGGRP